MNNLMALAQGLRAAGGVLSPDVYKANQEEDIQRERQRQAQQELMARQRQAQQQFMAQRVISAVESGAMPKEQGMAALQRLGMGLPDGSLGPTPEAQARMDELDTGRMIRDMAPQFATDGKLNAPALVAAVAAKDPVRGASIAKALGIDMQREPLVLGPDQIAVDRNNPDQVIARGAPKPRELTDIERYQAAIDQLPEGDPRRARLEQRLDILTTRDKRADPAPSTLGKLIAERDALPPDSPLRAEYDKRIALETTRAPGVSVSFGSPVAGVDAQNNPVFFQPSKDGGAPSILSGVRPAPRDSNADGDTRLLLQLRGQLKSEEAIKQWDRVAPVVATVNGYMARIAKGEKPNPASDNDLIRSFVKASDPSGNISNWEQQRLQALAGVPSRVAQSVVNFTEGALLPDEVRAYIAKATRERAAELRKLRDAKGAEYRSFAESQRLDPDQVFKAEGQSAPGDRFQAGRTYTDKNGNKAVYRGNGQWEEVK